MRNRTLFIAVVSGSIGAIIGILIYILGIYFLVSPKPCPPTYTYNLKAVLHDTLVIIKTKDRIALPDSLEEISMSMKTGKISRILKPRSEVPHITASGWGTTHSGDFHGGTKDTIYEHQTEYY